jgi:catechol 2,3-dioxygenase-like lactoylglutathione lyase family enzyme
MPKVMFGDHAALPVRAAESDRIRGFYRDVLGCNLNRSFPTKDDFRIGADYYIPFLHGGTGGGEPEKGATYSQEEALSDDGLDIALGVDGQAVCPSRAPRSRLVSASQGEEV